MNLRKAFLIFSVILVLTFQACGPNKTVVSTPIVAVTTAPTATIHPTPSKITRIPFGSSVSVDLMKIAVTGTIRPADGLVASGDMFNTQPHEYQHYIFITLDVTCETTTDQQCHLDLFKLKLLGSDGSVKYPKWFISGVDGILKDTDFQGGTTISGNVPFIVSVGDSGLLLVYESLSGDSDYLALP
ncbi:MAG: hypothetical protein HY863_19045 [Chloroflexi bacterium]|nr:hypothetical protein [Chloroflexota bacterium]